MKDFSTLAQSALSVNVNVINRVEIKMGQGWCVSLYYIFVEFKVIWKWTMVIMVNIYKLVRQKNVYTI